MSGMLLLRSRWLPGARGLGSLLSVSAWSFLMLALLLCLPSAQAQQLWHVDHDVIFIPQDGLALNAHTGRLLWRWPRFDGSVVTNGHGLLLISYLSRVDRVRHVRGTSVCRLNTRRGQRMWCREFLQLRAWVLDTTRKEVYVQYGGQLDVVDVATGRSAASFGLRDRNASLYPLPRGGVLLLDNGPARTVAGFYHPGDRTLVWRTFPMYLHPFQGNGQGLLLYASEQGEFYLPGLKLLYRRPPASEGFPVAGSDGEGFVFTDRQGPRPVLRGGTYNGALWKAGPIQQQPSLLLDGGKAIVLERLSDAPRQTRLHLLDIATGQSRLKLDLPPGLRAIGCNGRQLLLEGESTGNDAMVMVNLATGTVDWSIKQAAGETVLADTALVFWGPNGLLMARARNNGALLWRDRFQFDPHHPQSPQ